MNTIDLFVFGLATWRVSSLLVNERGPFDVFLRFRRMAGITHDPEGRVEIIPDGFLPGVLSCVWCASIWVGFLWIMFYTLLQGVAYFLGYAFALSALAIVMDRWIR